LDLQGLGFKNTQPVTGAGQPPYGPAALLKLYLYGYLQGIRRSRKLEVMWLIEGLQPTYKTIADFHKLIGSDARWQ
jgi:transposase